MLVGEQERATLRNCSLYSLFFFFEKGLVAGFNCFCNESSTPT